VWGIVVIVLGADEVEDDFLGGVSGDFVFDVDGVQAAEEEIAGVGHDGAAARGEAVLGEEEQETGEELVDFAGGLELGEIAEEFGGETGIGIAAGGTEEMAAAKAGLRVDGIGLATATAGRAMNAAGSGLAKGWIGGR
jgi:hypothetical protein